MQTKSLSRMGHGASLSPGGDLFGQPRRGGLRAACCAQLHQGGHSARHGWTLLSAEPNCKTLGLRIHGSFFPQNDFLASFDWHRFTWIRKNEKLVFATENLGSPDANPVEETFLPKRPLEAAV